MNRALSSSFDRNYAEEHGIHKINAIIRGTHMAFPLITIIEDASYKHLSAQNLAAE